MNFLLDEMYGERVAELLNDREHDALHVRSAGLGGAPDADVLARAVGDGRVLITENAADFLPLLNGRQGAGVAMTSVLVALTAGRGVGGADHLRLTDDIDAWAADNPHPYAHAHWLP